MKSIFLVLVSISVFVGVSTGPNDPHIFTIAGIRQFRRFNVLKINGTDSNMVELNQKPAGIFQFKASDKNASRLLRRYLNLKSALKREFYEATNTKRYGNKQPLQDCDVRISKDRYTAKNVYFEGPDSTILLKKGCYSSLKELPGELEDIDEIGASDQHNISYPPDLKIEQKIFLKDLKIQGILSSEGCSSLHNFMLILRGPRMEATYIQALSSSQGIVTKKFTEGLTFENVTMKIDGRVILMEEPQNLRLQETITENWIAPIMDAIKSVTFKDVFYRSESHFHKYVRDVLRKITENVFTVISYFSHFEELYDIDDEGDIFLLKGYEMFDFKHLHVAHYQSVPEYLPESSSGNYSFLHLFYMKFKSNATKMNYPRVQYSGIKRNSKFEAVLGHSDEVPVKELSVKFRVKTNKFGVPLTWRTGYEVALKLEIDETSRKKSVYLIMQERLEKRMAKNLQNDLYIIKRIGKN